MSNLFSKDENLHSSPPIFAYSLLKYMKKKKLKKISIFDVTDAFQAETKLTPKALYFAMIFLYSIGIIRFEQPYIILNDEN